MERAATTPTAQRWGSRHLTPGIGTRGHRLAHHRAAWLSWTVLLRSLISGDRAAYALRKATMAAAAAQLAVGVVAHRRAPMGPIHCDCSSLLLALLLAFTLSALKKLAAETAVCIRSGNGPGEGNIRVRF